MSFITMLTEFQQVKNNMYDILLNRLNDIAFIYHKQRKYKVQGIFSAPTITPNIGDLNTEIVEPQFIIKAKTLQVLNAQLAPDKLAKNFILEISSGDSYINNELYKIVALEPDSSGLIVLILRKTTWQESENEYYYGDTI